MARLTEEMVIARSKQSDLSSIRKLNCWGSDLGDVSVIRRMPNVEVLALSINKIRSLSEFSGLLRLRELYVRKNDIRDLREIRHLRRLPALSSLWLDENPCTEHPEYRMTVLRNLPNLEKLDNLPVQPEEVSEALRRGLYIPDSDDEGYEHQQQQEAYSECRRRSSDSSPEREEYRAEREVYRPQQGSDSSEGAPEAAAEARGENTQVQSWANSARRSEDEPSAAMTRSQCEARCVRSPDAAAAAALRHSLSAQSVKEYSYGNGAVSPPSQQYYDRHERSEAYCPAAAGAAAGTRCEGGGGGAWGEREAPREIASAVMGEHRGFTRRPVTRNSNLLSAVLCLLKELDYPSLEVAEMAVRCRMDELANQ